MVLPTGAWPQEAYVSNEDGHSVTVIDTQRGEAIATIAVGKRPRGLKVSHDGTRLYVAVSGLPKCPPSVPDEECAKLERDLKADGIAVVDTASRKVLKVLPAGSDPEQFDISGDGKRLFVANEDSATTSVVELESGKTVASVPVGREPEGVVISPNGRWILVTNESDNSVSMIDAATLRVVKSVTVGKRPRDLAFTADSSQAYVSGEFDSSLYRIRVPAGEPVERLLQLRSEARPMTVVLDERGKRLYMSTGRGGTVAVVDLLEQAPGAKLLTEIPVGTRPWGIALSADGRSLYTANGPSNDVTVVDTKTLKVVRKIPVGSSPWGIAISPVANPRPPTNVAPTASRSKAATTPRIRLQIAVHLRQLFGPVGITEHTASFARQRSVVSEGRGLDEVVVGQGLGNPIDGAGTLVQGRELGAVARDAIVHVFDARLGRIVIARGCGIGLQRQGCGNQADHGDEACATHAPRGSMA